MKQLTYQAQFIVMWEEDKYPCVQESNTNLLSIFYLLNNDVPVMVQVSYERTFIMAVKLP